MSPVDPRLKAAFAETLVKTARKLRTRFNAEVVRHGLTYPRARVLAVLSERQPLRQTELAADLGLEGPTVVRLLDGMEALGLIARRAVAGDRRAKHVELTEHGAEQAETVAAISAKLRDTILEGRDEAEVAVALDLLRAIADVLDRPMEGDGA
ncbi:MarR family winged helix-turn-helix transcriptional regulator [Aureimonas sp. SK2]|uniref:MarR family winged helix-turn-helix transcriptional regulator n=1 Tax=Aureimonas sp. SK2 TaxID=3015992 RepID=UPI00244442ED|nr:MarR family transcriptional regulator [Aureimonas sp. SK2]